MQRFKAARSCAGDSRLRLEKLYVTLQAFHSRMTLVLLQFTRVNGGERCNGTAAD